MTLTVFLIVLFAAVIHASWNALVKSTSDKLVSMTAVTIGHAPLALIVMPFVPVPAAESWKWLAFSVVAHTAYQLTLALAYRLGDFTQVYPIARCSGPTIVTIISVSLLGVVLVPTEYAAIALICGGIFCLGLLRGINGLHNPKAVGAALLTGCFIATYSLLDGMGARAAGTGMTAAIGFVAWLTVINALVFACLIGVINRPALRASFTEGRKVMLLGGTGSVAAYGLVVWAMTQAPIPLVTALRETSTIFALFIGVLFLKERLSAGKVVATVLTACGVLLLRFGGDVF